jgi:predicted MarR family transcription regulator
MEKQKRAAARPAVERAKPQKVVPLRRQAAAPHVGTQPKRHGEIVSSSHLANSEIPELSEFEFGLIVVGHAFNRWIARCMAAAGLPGLAPMDVLVLHHVHHRARDKRLADIAFTLNVEDLHVVNYSLKKLLAAQVVEATKSGKEVLYRTNDQGKAYIDRYREIRERCLVAGLSRGHGDGDTVHETARTLRWLSGLYDQAARAATSL